MNITEGVVGLPFKLGEDNPSELIVDNAGVYVASTVCSAYPTKQTALRARYLVAAANNLPSIVTATEGAISTLRFLLSTDGKNWGEAAQESLRNLIRGYEEKLAILYHDLGLEAQG